MKLKYSKDGCISSCSIWSCRSQILLQSATWSVAQFKGCLCRLAILLFVLLFCAQYEEKQAKTSWSWSSKNSIFSFWGTSSLISPRWFQSKVCCSLNPLSNEIILRPRPHLDQKIQYFQKKLTLFQKNFGLFQKNFELI